MTMSPEQIQMAENQAEVISNEVKQLSYEMDEVEHRLDQWAYHQRYGEKTVEEWSNYFNVEINPNATPVEIKNYAAKFSERMDTAYREKGKVHKKLGEYKAKFEEAKGQIIEGHATNRTRKTIPAADTLVKVAEAELGIRTSFCIRLENELNFWQDVIFKLHSNIKLINIMSMSNGTLVKLEGAY
jgi:uncharacterized coiled-coil DUF342 family protein